MALRAVRALALVLAALALAALVLIVLGIPAPFEIRLARFREPTWVLWGALALFAVAREAPGDYLGRAAARGGAILGSTPFFLRMTAVFLALYLLVAIRAHLSFRTFSHDFSMFDESLWWSHHGRFLFSPVLGRSYLTEHIAPILSLLVPVHALLPSHWLLVLASPVLLWSAVLPLRSLLQTLDISPGVRNLACLVYLSNPITVAALDYGFHVEVFLPLVLFGAYAAHRWTRPWLYAALLVTALAIKEDVGLYLVGLGAFLFVAEKRRLRGVLTAAVGIAWVLVVVFVVSPRLAGGSVEYRFLSRWEAWGGGPGGVLIGMITHPVAVLLALAAPAYLLFFWRLLFTPFFSRWSFLLLAVPWVLGATSGARQQATLSLYYGLPLLSFAALAAAHGLGSRVGKRFTTGRAAPAFGILVMMLNVAHFTIHPVPPERGPLLEIAARIPRGSTVQAMPALYPTLRYEQSKSVLMPGDSLVADVVLLRRETTAWPFSREQVDDLVVRAKRGDYESAFEGGGFHMLRRRQPYRSR